MTACPHCGHVGRKVGERTLQHHVDAAVWARIPSQEGWAFCATLNCAVAYYAPSAPSSISVPQLRSVPYRKSEDPERLVCFCFEHSVAAVGADTQGALRAAVVTACREALSDCERCNPEGRCCLAQMAEVMAQARDQRAASSTCCDEG